MSTTTATTPTLAERIESLNWDTTEQAMGDTGYATLPPLLTADECGALRALYDEPQNFRSRVDMERHRFGRGEYQYFAAPLPPAIQEMRTAFYPHLAKIANGWMEKLGDDVRYPAGLSSFLDRCHAAGQTKPTPLLLRYRAGGYNCLHQDLYGAVAFPFQVIIALSERGEEYTGGELLLVEQRPRAQSRGYVITLEQGAALIFPTHHRPLEGSRGYHRFGMRHGVSTVTCGIRYSLGLIFHDAQ
ncbi:MAG: 2OG-Fe(II) oxygenase [Chloroflexota bacterium]